MAINMEFEQFLNDLNSSIIINNNNHYNQHNIRNNDNRDIPNLKKINKDSINNNLSKIKSKSPTLKPSRTQLRKISSLIISQETKIHPLNSSNSNNVNNDPKISSADFSVDDCSSDCDCNYSDDQSSSNSDDISYNSYISLPTNVLHPFSNNNNDNRNYTCTNYNDNEEDEDYNPTSMSVSSSISSLITTPLSFNESISSLSYSSTTFSPNNYTRSSSTTTTTTIISSNLSLSPTNNFKTCLTQNSFTSDPSQSISFSTVSSQINNRSLPSKTSISASSTDSLYNLLKNSKSKTTDQKPLVKKSLVSNLTTSVQNFKNSTKDKLISFISDSPRLTDDKLPIDNKQQQKKLANIKIEEEEEILHQSSEELITFNETEHEHDTILPETTTTPLSTVSKSNEPKIRTIFKNRDQRINSQFMRLYAYDYNSRINSKTLPNSLTQEDLYTIIKKNPNLKKFHKQFNIYKISNLSREKLWNSVILKPRIDDSPLDFIDSENYIYLPNLQSNSSESNTITRKKGKYLPWDLKPSIKPCGILKNGHWEINGKSPNSGITKTQYTVKGWCNKRWIDCSQ